MVDGMTKNEIHDLLAARREADNKYLRLRPAVLLDGLDAMKKLPEFTAADFAEATGLSIEAANANLAVGCDMWKSIIYGRVQRSRCKCEITIYAALNPDGSINRSDTVKKKRYIQYFKVV